MTRAPVDSGRKRKAVMFRLVGSCEPELRALEAHYDLPAQVVLELALHTLVARSGVVYFDDSEDVSAAGAEEE